KFGSVKSARRRMGSASPGRNARRIVRRASLLPSGVTRQRSFRGQSQNRTAPEYAQRCCGELTPPTSNVRPWAAREPTDTGRAPRAEEQRDVPQNVHFAGSPCRPRNSENQLWTTWIESGGL